MGQKTAVCIGIDQYGGANQLSGCVNDARNWSRFFQGAGFQVIELLDGNATYDGIIRGIQSLVSQARAGDLIAVQYAGHGTQIPDRDGDEVDGEDEAIVPIDFASSDVIVDDVIGPLFDRAVPGVAINVFFDCCHSGGATRLLAPSTFVPRGFRGQTKIRYMPPTEAMIARHREHLKRLGRQRGTRGVIETDGRMREFLFAACQPNEVSLESNGHGVFTTAALSVLQNGFAGLTNSTFIQNTVAMLGPGRRQTPQLSCAPGTQNNPFLSASAATSPATGGSQAPTIDEVLSGFQTMNGNSAATPTVPVTAPPASHSIDDLIAGLNAIANAGRSLRQPNSL